MSLSPWQPSADFAFVVDISHPRHEEQRMQFIMRELSHPSKNRLAVNSNHGLYSPERTK
jgi:hypothetical protein